MKLKKIPGIRQEILDELQKEKDEYEAWQRGEIDVPSWLDMSINDPEKLEALCK
jgi:hypothetical protein